MLVPTRKRKSSRSAFTLVEMLVVVAIILALAAIAVPITLNVLDASRREIAKSQCKGLLSQAVVSYQLDSEVNPDGGLPGSWADVKNSRKASLAPEATIDPWGREYHLAVPGSHARGGVTNQFDIWSDCGGSADSVGNW
jgi:prepilin-type N-terminal cleavage/methylation domain-containing protein